MVANLSAHKRGWENELEFYSHLAEELQDAKEGFLVLVDKDTEAFEGVMKALALPKQSPEQQAERKAALDEANLEALRVPL